MPVANEKCRYFFDLKNAEIPNYHRIELRVCMK